MAGRISVECPGCLAKLNLPDSSKLGKKIKCPKCSDIFVAEAAEGEDLDDLVDDDAPVKSSGGRQRAASGSRKGATKSRKTSGGSGSSNGPLIAGGAVAVVALIGLGLFLSGIFASKPIPAPPAEPPPVAAVPVAVPVVPAPPAMTDAERMLGLRWMPKETELVFHAKVGELWQAPLLKQLVDRPESEPFLNELKKGTGLTPADIESVSVGFIEFAGMNAIGASLSMGMPAAPPKIIAVIRTKKSMSLEEITMSNSQLPTAEHNSKKYIQGMNGQMSGWIAEPTTLVMAPEIVLKAAMDRGETVIPRKALTFADATPHVVLIAAPISSKSMATPPLPGMSAEFAAMQKTLDESLTAFAIGLNIRGGFDLQTSLLLRDADGAGIVKAGIDSGLVEGRKAFEAFKATGQPLLAGLGDQLLSNLKVDTQSQTVKISTNLPDSAQQDLEKVPPLLMLMAMTGGMGTGGNPFDEPMAASSSLTPAESTSLNSPGIRSPEPRLSDAVIAETAEGLPENSTLAIRTSWSPVPQSDGTLPMQLHIDLQGDVIAEIVGFGQLAIKPMPLPGGGTARVFKSEPGSNPGPLKAMVPFDPADAANLDHPEGTMRMRVSFQAPAESVTAIESLDGTFKIVTASEYNEFTIENAPKTAKRMLTVPELKEAGVKLLLTKSETGGELLSLSCAKEFFLAAHATDPDNPRPDGMVWKFAPAVDRNQSILRIEAAKFPENLQVHLKLFRDIKELPVSFKFSNVPLPGKETKPIPVSVPAAGEVPAVGAQPSTETSIPVPAQP